MTRTALAAALLLLAAGAAQAQTTGTGTQPGTGTGQTGTTSGLASSDFLIRLKKRVGTEYVFVTNAYEEMTFFNRARCECAEPLQIDVRLTDTGLAKRTTDAFLHNGVVTMIIGSSDCIAEMASTRDHAHCRRFDSEQIRLSDLGANSPKTFNVTADMIFDRGTKTTNPCVDQGQQNIMLDVRANNDPANPDLTGSNAPLKSVLIDGMAPAAPTEVTAEGGNEAITVRWNAVKGVADLDGYVVFCARGGELPVFADSRYTNQYSFCASPKTGSGVQPLTQALVTAGPDGLPVAPPAAFTRLDPAYLCSDFIPFTTTEARISVLQNAIPYVFGVAALDKTRNASVVTAAVLQYPVPTRDFYRGYRAAGGDADGGFCAYGRRAPTVASPALLAVAAALTALARRRRR